METLVVSGEYASLSDVASHSEPGSIVVLATMRIPMNALTTLPPATGLPTVTCMLRQNWMLDEHDTPRRSGFAAVFDTDIELLQREVGCHLFSHLDGRHFTFGDDCKKRFDPLPVRSRQFGSAILSVRVSFPE
jgi:hypothetical protein